MSTLVGCLKHGLSAPWAQILETPSHRVPVSIHTFKITGAQTPNLEYHFLSKLMTFLEVFALNEAGTWEWGEGKYVVIMAIIYSLFTTSMAPHILYILF